MKKIRLLVLCGGKSAEHKISLVSTWNLLNSLSNDEFEIRLITIDEEGNWFLQKNDLFLKQEANPNTISIQDKNEQILLCPGNSNRKFYNLSENQFLDRPDVIFPLLHGPNGEDGRLQGALDLLQIPYIGSGVLGSAICMDKVVAKNLFVQSGIPTSQFISFRRSEKERFSFEIVKQEVGLPMFVKPANLGSSVGINKVRNEDEYYKAIDEAFKYDSKILIEEFIEGIEVECAVLGNEELIVSKPGTYVHTEDFFDYETKYLDKTVVEMQIPVASLSASQHEELSALSAKAYKALNCEGFARVDTFVTPDGRFLVNEINSIPGFTQHSMYPILMEKTGIPYNELVKKMVKLAIERFNENQ